MCPQNSNSKYDLRLPTRNVYGDLIQKATLLTTNTGRTANFETANFELTLQPSSIAQWRETLTIIIFVLGCLLRSELLKYRIPQKIAN